MFRQLFGNSDRPSSPPHLLHFPLATESDPDDQETQVIRAPLTADECSEQRKPIHILVAEDDPGLRGVIAEFLEDQGFSVGTAGDGATALEAVHRERPSVILLDLYMPVMDGWTFAGELHAEGIEIPIVVMTAAWAARQRAEELGAVAYVPKPVNLPALVSQLDRLCA